MTELAESRGDDPAKYHIGIGQDQMAVNRANEDIITLGANAASKIVTEKDRELIDMVIVGTESGIDHSSECGNYPPFTENPIFCSFF